MLKETVEWCKPNRATRYSAMVDLYAKEDVVIGAGETKIVNLGVKVNIDGIFKALVNSGKEMMEDWFLKSHFIELHPRSSLRAKGLIVGVGVVDLDFPNELGLIVHNPFTGLDDNGNATSSTYPDLDSDYTIKKGDKIAQCTLMEHKGYLLGIESDVERSGGFGSTDKEKL